MWVNDRGRSTSAFVTSNSPVGARLSVSTIATISGSTNVTSTMLAMRVSLRTPATRAIFS